MIKEYYPEWDTEFLQYENGRLYRVLVFANKFMYDGFWQRIEGKSLAQYAWFERELGNGVITLWTLYDPSGTISDYDYYRYEK